MANTYTQIFIHIVFSVKGRQNLITNGNREILQKYFTGIVQKHNHKLLSVYCMPDHTHLLAGINPSESLSTLVRDIKAGTSKYINENRFIQGHFSWQEGYGAFSYSKSSLNKVIEYINNQQEHHKKISFKEEYIELLQKFQIEYKDEYLFEWI